MGSIFSPIMKLFNLIFEVLLSAKLVVWDAVLDILDPFIQPWRNLFWFCFNVYVCLWSEIGFRAMKILVLPVRIYDALQKEDMLKAEMQRVQELHKVFKTRLGEVEFELEQMFGECSRYKELLKNAEAEKRALMKKLQVLQLQVMKLEEENGVIKSREECLLKGVHEKTILALQKNIISNKFEVTSHDNEFEMVCCNKIGLTETQLSHTPLKNVVEKTPSQLDDKQKVRSTPLQLDNRPKRIPPAASDNSLSVDYKPKYDGWEAAIFSSIFSMFLTLLVGTIVWQAQDPCVPLVVAVFMVVCMSLKTVAQFLLSIYSGPGFDAVALLSFNWFILGTLAYPVLPRLAQIVAPIGSRFGHWFFRFMGVSYVAEQLKSAFF